VLLLCSFKEQLQQHVRVHAMEAVMGCWELEQSLQSLTGGHFFSFCLYSLIQKPAESFIYALLAFILSIIAALLSDDKVVSILIARANYLVIEWM
jgi:hypothetical protein